MEQKWENPAFAGLSFSRPVSRILSRVIIPLGSYPGPGRAASWRAPFALHRTGVGEPPRRRDAGGRLPHRFTLSRRRLRGSAVGGFVFFPLFLSFCPPAFATR